MPTKAEKKAGRIKAALYRHLEPAHIRQLERAEERKKRSAAAKRGAQTRAKNKAARARAQKVAGRPVRTPLEMYLREALSTVELNIYLLYGFFPTIAGILPRLRRVLIMRCGKRNGSQEIVAEIGLPTRLQGSTATAVWISHFVTTAVRLREALQPSTWDSFYRVVVHGRKREHVHVRRWFRFPKELEVYQPKVRER